MIPPSFTFWEQLASNEEHDFLLVFALDCRLQLEGSQDSSAFLSLSKLRFQPYSFRFVSSPSLALVHLQFHIGLVEGNYAFARAHPYHQILSFLALRDAK